MQIFIVVWALFVIGWIANIVQVIQQMPTVLVEATPMWIVKIICIFAAPVGSVLGWIGMF